MTEQQQVAIIDKGSMLVPNNFDEAFKLADMMSNAKLVPVHLQGKPSDCLMVIEQASRWKMSPFGVAQSTSVIQGKLMYEGKLVAAVVNANGNLSERLSYEYAGTGETRSITVSGKIRGEKSVRTISVALKDARTANKQWQTQPDQQLMYHGARMWARRHMPELMFGVYSPEEVEASDLKDVTPDTIEDKHPLHDKFQEICIDLQSAKNSKELADSWKKHQATIKEIKSTDASIFNKLENFKTERKRAIDGVRLTPKEKLAEFNQTQNTPATEADFEEVAASDGDVEVEFDLKTDEIIPAFLRSRAE